MIISREQCDATVQLLSKDDIYLDGVRDALIRSGLAELCGLTIDQAKLDPYRPCPGSWTAFQLAFFDNGPIEKKRNRPKIQRTRMQFGGNIKVWTTNKVRFTAAKDIAWQANFYLWTAEQAKVIVRDLMDEKYVGQETVTMMDEVTADAGDNLRFSIPMLKLDGGTRWMRSHVVITSMGQDGRPEGSVVLFPETEFATNALDSLMPNGGRFHGTAISQARVARLQDFAPWATEVVS